MPTWRKEIHARNAELAEQSAQLVLDDICQCADYQQTGSGGNGGVGHRGDQGLETRILALRESRLDPATGIVEDADVRAMISVEPLRRTRQVEFDDLGRA